MKTCSETGCSFRVHAKNLCKSHYYSAWQKENKERQTAYKLAWAAANPDRVMASRSRPEAMAAARQRAAEWYLSNKERAAKASMERYQKADKNKLRAQSNENRRKQPPGTRTVECQNRRARLSAAAGSHTLDEREAKFAEYGNKCSCCGADLGAAPDFYVNKALWRTLDHVQPINKGGSNWISNLVPMCGSCNFSKQDKWEK